MQRRTYLKKGGIVLGAAVSSTLAGCSSSGSSDETPTDGNGTTAAGGTTTAGMTAAETTAAPSLQDQLQAVESATAKYTDPKAALEDGFKAGGPYVPGMGWHFQHPKRGKNGLELEKPNVLTYLETDDGLQLGAVEYAVPSNAIEKTPDLFADEEADATEKWHPHKAATHVFATPDMEQTPPPELTFEQLTTRGNWAEFHPPDSDLKPGDTVSLNWGSAKGKQGDRTERVIDIVTTHPSLTTLHVWVHTDNPDGVFAPMNPDFMEGEGGHHHEETATEHDH